MERDFWAAVKFVSERGGYTNRSTKEVKQFSPEEILGVYKKEMKGNDYLHRFINITEIEDHYLKELSEYFEYRADVLNVHFEQNLMDVSQARQLFVEVSKRRSYWNAPFPQNKQSGDKKKINYLTALVNMIIEENLDELTCDYDPHKLPLFARKVPIRVFSRRLDGAFPSIVNPIALWEIKEYYYTTTFGSRVADGVYETMLDGLEIEESKENTEFYVEHILFIDGYFTWWDCGRSYLCRLIDILNMGLVDSIIVGREVISALPEIVKGWKERLYSDG
ncbi:MAG TPA: hypothetical protein PKN37_01540 [Mesotoga sp.]|nr:hypothetical protein [Mesotoga sp.]